MWLLPGKDPLQVLPDLPVEHAVEQEDEEALDRGRWVRKEARARSLPHYTPTRRPGDMQSAARPCAELRVP